MKGKVEAVCTSERKGTKKNETDSVLLIANHGIDGDAHAGNHHRQISLLPIESVDVMRKLIPNLKAGDFAENILTSGIDLKSIPVGSLIYIGDTVLKVTQIGKKCHNECEIKKAAGICIMPKEGIFAAVQKGGIIKNNMEIKVELL